MKKRKALKNILLTEIISFVAIIIVVITAINIKIQSDKITDLTKTVLSRESVSYAGEVYNWWSSVEERVRQTANVMRNIPGLSTEETHAMLLKLTELDPDSQDIYIGYGKTGLFLDGSGWIPDDTFVFTGRGWYLGALDKKGEIYTSDPYVDAATGKTCLACAVMLQEDVVLSSDVNFDKISETLNGFLSSSSDATYFIVNKGAKDILASNQSGASGQIITESTDPIIQGLASVFDMLNDAGANDADKVKTADTSIGKYMYTSSDIEETSWMVVSAVPYSFVSESILQSVKTTFSVAVILLVLLALLLYFIITKYLNPVSKMTEKIIDISKGDFTVTLVPEGNNELTTLSEQLNEYISTMRKTLQNLAEISGEMNSSAGACYDISNVLSSANRAQGESIEKLNDTLGTMNRSIEVIAGSATDLADTSNQLADRAEDVRKLCEETMNASASGKREMENMTHNVNTLSTTVRELTKLIAITAKSIEEITGITNTINEIASQTNLLALNASIESARAGELGKGFAVVASEVGALAKQSTDATDSIRSLIDSITQNIKGISQKANICMTDMEACLKDVEGTNRSFEQIYEDVRRATESMISITGGIDRITQVASNNAHTTHEQASAINEILGLSETIVRENGKLSSETENISSVSRDLNQYSDEIKSDLSHYNLK